PGGEPRPLQQRAGLVRDDVREGAPVAQRPDDAEPGPPAQAGEGAGVAVRVHLERPVPHSATRRPAPRSLSRLLTSTAVSRTARAAASTAAGPAGSRAAAA